ncbi:hypothetical protein Tco_0312262 [Tanacetum coccineum]
MVSSGVKPSSRWLPVWESTKRRPTPFAVRLLKTWQSSIHPKLFDPNQSLIVSIFAQSVAPPSVGPAITSPIETNHAFVEANYEVLESLLRERKRRMRNEYLRNELEYFKKEYEEEQEMETRPARTRETTPVLRMESLRVRR